MIDYGKDYFIEKDLGDGNKVFYYTGGDKEYIAYIEKFQEEEKNDDN